MTEFMLTPARKVDCARLLQRLTEMHVPFRDVSKGPLRLIRVGPEGEFDVAVAMSRANRVSKASITIRYDHPMLKDILIRWLDDCGVAVHEDFYKSQFGLPPSVIDSIRGKWRLDLRELQVTPIRLCKNVAVFMFRENVSSTISTQLAGVPHKRMTKDDFVKSPDWGVEGESGGDVEVYWWSGGMGEQFLVTDWSAPVVTMLALWEVPAGAPVEINLKGILPGVIPNH